MIENPPTCEHCKRKPVRVVRFENPTTYIVSRLCEDCVSVVLKSDMPFPDKMQLLKVRELP
jgi:hypothetical protein